MSHVFADSSFYIAVISIRDSLHVRTTAVMASLNRRVITTEYVLLEVAAFFSKAQDRQLFVDLANGIYADPHTHVLSASTAYWNRGFDLFAARPDKDWSLTDCTSFVVMTDLGLADALTADRHFVQAGFNALLV